MVTEMKNIEFVRKSSCLKPRAITLQLFNFLYMADSKSISLLKYEKGQDKWIWMEYQVRCDIRHLSSLVNLSSVTSKHIYIYKRLNYEMYYNCCIL